MLSMNSVFGSTPTAFPLHPVSPLPHEERSESRRHRLLVEYKNLQSELAAQQTHYLAAVASLEAEARWRRVKLALQNAEHPPEDELDELSKTDAAINDLTLEGLFARLVLDDQLSKKEAEMDELTLQEEGLLDEAMEANRVWELEYANLEKASERDRKHLEAFERREKDEEKEAMREDIKELEEVLKDQVGLCHELTAQNHQLKDLRDELEEALKEQVILCRELTAQNNEWKDTRDEMEEVLRGQVNVCRQLTEQNHQVKDVRDGLEEALEEQVVMCRQLTKQNHLFIDEREELEEVLQEQVDICRQLTEQNHQSKDVHGELEAVLEEQVGLCRQLTEQIEQAKAARGVTAEDLQRVKLDVCQLSHALSDAVQTILGLRESLAEAEENISTRKEKESSLERAIEADRKKSALMVEKLKSEMLEQEILAQRKANLTEVLLRAVLDERDRLKLAQCAAIIQQSLSNDVEQDLVDKLYIQESNLYRLNRSNDEATQLICRLQDQLKMADLEVGVDPFGSEENVAKAAVLEESRSDMSLSSLYGCILSISGGPWPPPPDAPSPDWPTSPCAAELCRLDTCEASQKYAEMLEQHIEMLEMERERREATWSAITLEEEGQTKTLCDEIRSLRQWANEVTIVGQELGVVNEQLGLEIQEQLVQQDLARGCQDALVNQLTSSRREVEQLTEGWTRAKEEIDVLRAALSRAEHSLKTHSGSNVRAAKKKSPEKAAKENATEQDFSIRDEHRTGEQIFLQTTPSDTSFPDLFKNPMAFSTPRTVRRSETLKELSNQGSFNAQKIRRSLDLKEERLCRRLVSQVSTIRKDITLSVNKKETTPTSALPTSPWFAPRLVVSCDSPNGLQYVHRPDRPMASCRPSIMAFVPLPLPCWPEQYDTITREGALSGVERICKKARVSRGR